MAHSAQARSPTIEMALATFERSIVSGQAPFDRWINATKPRSTPPRSADSSCSTARRIAPRATAGGLFTDASFHDIGTARGDEIGRGRLFPGSVVLRYAFKTPTLRDVARRAPYMHDGSVPTLQAVIDLYDRGGIDRPSPDRNIRPLGLTADEKADFIAFLQTERKRQSKCPSCRADARYTQRSLRSVVGSQLARQVPAC